MIQRATEESGNLRATQRARESLQTYATKYGGGIIGLVSDLGTIPDQRIARAVSNVRRAAMSSAVVASERVVYDFRCRGLYSGPLNFLPIRTLMLDHPGAGVMWANNAVGAGGGGVNGGGNAAARADDLLPSAPESPAPDGFLGYVVRLMQLRPEHEPLRWTVLFAVFKDLAVFETEAQGQAVKARMPNQRLFYCSLDFPGSQTDPCPPGGAPLPHIGHWGFRPLLDGTGSAGSDRSGGVPGLEDWTPGSMSVSARAEQFERNARGARRALAFLQYGGGGRRNMRGQDGDGRLSGSGVPAAVEAGADAAVVGGVRGEEQQQALGAVIHVVYG